MVQSYNMNAISKISALPFDQITLPLTPFAEISAEAFYQDKDGGYQRMVAPNLPTDYRQLIYALPIPQGQAGHMNLMTVGQEFAQDHIKTEGYGLEHEYKATIRLNEYLQKRVKALEKERDQIGKEAKEARENVDRMSALVERCGASEKDSPTAVQGQMLGEIHAWAKFVNQTKEEITGTGERIAEVQKELAHHFEQLQVFLKLAKNRIEPPESKQSVEPLPNRRVSGKRKIGHPAIESSPDPKRQKATVSRPDSHRQGHPKGRGQKVCSLRPGATAGRTPLPGGF